MATDQTESFLKASNWDLINGDLKFIKGSLGVLFEAMTDEVCDSDAVAEDFRSLLLEMKKKVEVIEGNVAKVFGELRSRDLLG